MMARSIDTTGDQALRTLKRTVDGLTRHTHPGIVTDPEPITGSRSGATASVLAQLLAALDAAGIIDDQTTG